jgi:hypothetical protein
MPEQRPLCDELRFEADFINHTSLELVFLIWVTCYNLNTYSLLLLGKSDVSTIW